MATCSHMSPAAASLEAAATRGHMSHTAAQVCTGPVGVGAVCATSAPPLRPGYCPQWEAVHDGQGRLAIRVDLPSLLGLHDHAHQDAEQRAQARRSFDQALARLLGELCVGQAPRGRRGAGSTTLRLRLRAETYAHYKRLERAARRWLPRGVSFIRFVTQCVWAVWRHQLESGVAWSHIYLRDGHQCQNPLCSRRDLSLHHLVFRGRGGDDSDENVITLCTECHLRLVHSFLIRAEPPASRVRWQFGTEPWLVVLGREKVWEAEGSTVYRTSPAAPLRLSDSRRPAWFAGALAA